MTKKKQSNHYAFIDSQNLNLSIRNVGWELDFARFYVYLKDKYKINKAFLFIGYLEEQKQLYAYLKEAGYTVIFKPTINYKREGEVQTKGNVDAELVLHAMIELPNYDKAMIVSGDGDFYCLVDYLKKQKKLSHVLIPNPKMYSALLRPFRKFFVYINNLKKKLAKKRMKKSPKKLPRKRAHKTPKKRVKKKLPKRKRGSNLRTKP